MILVILAIFGFLNGPNLIVGITVSPDLGLRNASTLPDQLNINNTKESPISLADRYRRLIPYMTFYIPNELPVSEHYNYMQMQMQQQQQQHHVHNHHHQQQQPNQQQKPVIALFHSQPQNNQQQPISQNIQNLRPNGYAQTRYPNHRPQYQAIVYNSRHQGNHNNNNHHHHNHNNHQVYRLPNPISFKESNYARLPIRYHQIQQQQQQHSTTKLNLTPFTPINKIPGQFTPIIYTEDINSINYNDKPQIDAVKQYQILDGEQQQQPQQNQHELDQKQRPDFQLESSTSTQSPPIQSNSISTPSPRPVYSIYNVQSSSSAPPPHQEEIVIQTPELTPEEKYVAYLQKQQDQQQKPQLIQNPQQHQTFIQLIKPSSAPETNKQQFYDEKQIEIPIKQYVYQQEHPTLEGNEDPEIYNQNPSPSTIQQNEQNQNYIEYSQQNQEIEDQQQQISIKDNYRGVKPIVFVTTAAPTIVTSVGYKSQVSQNIKTQQQIYQPQPQEYIIHQPKKNYQIKEEPIYAPQQASPSTPLLPVRQHLTETTQGPPPILTTYHPSNYQIKNSQQYTTPHHSISHPQKLKPSKRYKPIIVTKPIPSLITKPTPQNHQLIKEQPLPDIHTSSLAEILRKLQDSNHLPQTLTPDNIDNSIKTLIKILNNLKESQTIIENPSQHHEEDYGDYNDDDSTDIQNGDPGPNSGRPGIDYPALSEIPPTSFNCKEQRYKGFFGDPETNCQVWHYCDLNGGQASFLCPNGTIFSQVALTCDWWFNVKCASTPQLYVLNERLYKYILPFTPKFPEDYSGPLVDKYLALKFKEMEEKMRQQKLKGKMKEIEVDLKSLPSEDMEKGPDDFPGSNIDENDDHSSIDTYSQSSTTMSSISSTIAALMSSKQLPPIVQFKAMLPPITSTARPFMLTQKSNKPKVSVESEKVEVIEIKSDGSSGHLIPGQRY